MTKVPSYCDKHNAAYDPDVGCADCALGVGNPVFYDPSRSLPPHQFVHIGPEESNEMRLIKALCEALGFEIKATCAFSNPHTGEARYNYELTQTSFMDK